MQVIVPMAGLGSRFAAADYALPKPMIPVSGRPMVQAAVESLPPYERLIFVCHPEHVSRFGIDRMLRDAFPHCRIVVARGSTSGQAASVRLAAAHLDLDDSVLVAACDNAHVFRHEEWQRRVAASRSAVIVWTYRRDPRVLARPQAHGWVEADAAHRAVRISVKAPVSDHPYDDHCISGTFWFRSGRTLCDGIDALIAADRRVNGEFYLDSVPALMMERGEQVEVFQVDKYIGWGTPEDLQDYERWEAYFRTARDQARRETRGEPSSDA